MTGPTEADRQKVSEILGPRLHTLILTALWGKGMDREEVLDYTERQIKERIAQALCDVRDAERKRAVRIINESWLNPKKSMDQISREIEEDR